MSITPQDITQATEKMNQAWKLVRSLEDLASSIHVQLANQLTFIDSTSQVVQENESLQNQLAIVEDQKAKLLAEIETLKIKINTLQKDLDSRPPKVEDPPTPEPDPKPEAEVNKIIATIPFTIKDTTGQGRLSGEYAFTGIPLAQKLGVKDVDQLRVDSISPAEDITKPIIIADIRPTSYWPDGSIQWVQVVFPVEGFSDSIQYELLVYDKPQKLVTSQIAALGDTNIGDVEVRTGDRKWQVDIAGVHQEGLEARKGLNVTFDGKSSSDDYLRNLYVEYLGPLVCYVVVEGITDLHFSTYTTTEGLIRSAPISFRRRYQFLANCPLVTVQETIRWEGSFNGTSHEKNQPEKPYGQRDPNAVLGQLWRERFTLSSPASKCVVLPEEGKSTATFNISHNVSLEQKLRQQRLANNKQEAYPGTYEIRDGSGLVTFGESATGGLLSIQSENNYITVALKDMHLHEPQAIRLVGNEIQLDLSSGDFWLPHHSGVEVTYAIHVDDKQPDLNHIWRQVNKPLRGLCQPEQYNESGGFDCLGGIMIPTNPSDNIDSMHRINGYEDAMRYTVNNTITKMQAEGFQGLMTWGSVPRYWEEWGFNTGEMGSGIDGWDGLLRNWSATDYWCTFKLALEWAIRSGDPQWIETLTIPSAVRMLHTQIMQAAPDDSWFYAGQAPAGYAMYRSDFNSSHQYWENLYLYYLITGDRTVIDIIERGALNQINYMNDKKGVVGRQPVQWLQAYLFLSHCHYAEGSRLTFGRAFDMFLKKAVTEHYLQGTYLNETEAIWTQKKIGDPGNGVYESHQLFSLCFYDMEMLYHYGLRTGNAKVESLGVTPFDIMTRIAKTIIRRGIGSATKNVETSAWLRIFSVDYDGKGNFTRFEGGTVDNQKILFPDDKGTMCLFFSRCAWLSSDPEIKKVSRELVQLMFKQIAGRGLPFGKLIGMLMGRLSGAVAIEQMIEERDQERVKNV